MAAVLVLLQMGTGVLLKFVYEPTPIGAYASVQTLINDIPFGQLIRNVHHWGANLLVLIALLHMLRVFFTGAFQPPRQFNWIAGMGLFGLVLSANVSGYLLPWDQLAYWAVTVSTGMLEYVPWIGLKLQRILRGGSTIGAVSLRNFFAIHTAVIPMLLIFLMAFHFWRVRKAGGLVIPRNSAEGLPENPLREPTVPNLILREAAVAAVLIATVFILSIFFNAPLDDPANPGLSPNPTKAPWYFAGLQELLLHIHPMFAVCIIPLLVGMLLVSVPYLKYETDSGGIWFVSSKARRTGMLVAIATLLGTTGLILADDLIIAPGNLLAGLPSIITNGVIPFSIIAVIIAGSYLMLKKKFEASTNEAIQTVFIILVTALIVLTVIGAWFRGKGMVLAIPW
jgi:quinol-cytochrome oxidoreductase complex cytochrome b subunit